MIKSERALPYDVSIECSNNGGLIFSVGCKKFCCGKDINERKEIAQALCEYLIDPEGAMKNFYDSEEYSKSNLVPQSVTANEAAPARPMAGYRDDYKRPA